MSPDEVELERLRIAKLQALARMDFDYVVTLEQSIRAIETQILRQKHAAATEDKDNQMWWAEQRDLLDPLPEPINQALDRVRKMNEANWERARKEREAEAERQRVKREQLAAQERERIEARDRLRRLNASLAEEKKQQALRDAYFLDMRKQAAKIPPVAGPKGRRFDFDNES